MGSKAVAIIGSIVLAGLLGAMAAPAAQAQVGGAKEGADRTYDPTTGVSTKKPEYDPTTGVSTKKPEYDSTTGVSTGKPRYDPTTGLDRDPAVRGAVRGYNSEPEEPDAAQLPRMKEVTIQVYDRNGRPVEAEVEVTTENGAFNKTCTTVGGSCRMAVRCCPGVGMPVVYRVRARWRGLESREVFLVDCGFSCDQPSRWVIRYYTAPQAGKPATGPLGGAEQASPPSTLKRYTTGSPAPDPAKKKPPKRYDPDWRPWSRGK